VPGNQDHVEQAVHPCGGNLGTVTGNVFAASAARSSASGDQMTLTYAAVASARSLLDRALRCDPGEVTEEGTVAVARSAPFEQGLPFESGTCRRWGSLYVEDVQCFSQTPSWKDGNET
jgi:hypothetical protein